MKNIKIIYLLFVGFLLINSCNNKDDGSEVQDVFCDKERVFNKNILDETAQLIYLESKNKYALKYYPNYPLVDEVSYCVICLKPEGISINDAVKFSADLLNFNPNENYNPSVGGLNYYFTQIIQIKKIGF